MRQPDENGEARTAVELRDEVAADRDEVAEQRDTRSAERDRAAALRDDVADGRAGATTDHAQQLADRLWQAGREISRRLLGIAGADLHPADWSDLSAAARAQLQARVAERQQDAALESVAIRSTLDELRETFDCGRATRDAAIADRAAAAADRSAAAVDRAAAARDRDDTARDRQQAAIERELLEAASAGSPAPPDIRGPGSKAIADSRRRIADSRAALDRRSPGDQGR
jgi:hypothetical protein